MNGVHDMGGLQCFGPVHDATDETLFHEPWERDVLALSLAMGATGSWNLDQSRSERESLPPAYYLSAGYYRIWLSALERLLIKHELITEAELKAGHMMTEPSTLKRILHAKDVAAVLAAGSAVDRKAKSPQQYKIGDRVLVRNWQPTSHTRLPAYIRGHVGVIERIHGCHVFPDTHATGDGEQPQWLYNVRFQASELWGNSNSNSVSVDCWESYLTEATEKKDEKQDEL